MLEPVHISSVRPGFATLVHDPADVKEAWSLWERTGIDTCRLRVSWVGNVFDSPLSEHEDWQTSRFHHYPVVPEDVETIVLVARHLPDRQAWFRFCERWVTNR